mmetsp:Transcript_55502/g.119808  ORF Transcript_55502/g.119808 Transcript_55502/m.119808 type:complete len:175 (-) Transcript_55502:163-687(-)
MALFFSVLVVALFPWLTVASSDDEQLNIYGAPLQKCESETSSTAGSGSNGQCTFRSYDAGAHQVCVKALPGGFSSATGQGPWSDEFKSESWCICIWAYANYVTNKDPNDLPIKCDAISSYVLHSGFAEAHFKAGTSQFLEAVGLMCNTCKDQAATEAEGKALQDRCEALGVTVA